MTPEQKQRIEQIERGAERLRHERGKAELLAESDIERAYENTISDLLKDITDLLSLVKSQEAEPSIRVSAQWIINHHKSTDIDYACFECCRDRDDSTVVDGFICVYHRAKAAIQEQETKQS